MNRDDIIRLAREAGMGGMLTDVVCTHAELEYFAELVAAAEREACAQIADELHATTGRTFDHRAVAAAIRARGEK